MHNVVDKGCVRMSVLVVMSGVLFFLREVGPAKGARVRIALALQALLYCQGALDVQLLPRTVFFLGT